MKKNEKVIVKHYENGNQKCEFHVVGETLNGKQTVWSENGEKFYECFYLMGVPTGVWSVYHEDGSERFTLDLDKNVVSVGGMVVKGDAQDCVGMSKEEGVGTDVNDSLSYCPESDEWYLNTMMCLINKGDGIDLLSLNGFQKVMGFEGMWEFGTPVGVHTEYDEDRNKISENHYKVGKLELIL